MIDEQNQGRRAKLKNETIHSRREHDEFDMDDWTDREIALFGVRRVIGHEAVCAKRWGVIIKLMWASITGIGLIITGLTVNLITHWLVHRGGS